MGRWFQTRRWFLWRALWRPKPRMLVILWAVISTWDLLVAQFLPPNLAEKTPRVYDALAAMSGWLSLWAWALIGLAILLAISIEYGVRQKLLMGSSATENRQEPKPKEIFDLGAVSGNVILDLAQGNYFRMTVIGPLELTVNSAPPHGAVCEFEIELINGGSQPITWPARLPIDFNLSDVGVDIVKLQTTNSGETWRLSVSHSDRLLM